MDIKLKERYRSERLITGEGGVVVSGGIRAKMIDRNGNLKGLSKRMFRGLSTDVTFICSVGFSLEISEMVFV